MELKTESKRAVWTSILLAAALWIWISVQIPTFDLDESLYRRVAEELKQSGDPWHLSWDHRSLHHKPPLYYWWIALVSTVIDGVQAPVSALASRLSSTLVGIGVLFALPFWSRPYFLLSAFAILTVPAVIFDPLQSLALIPAILIPHRWFKEERNPLANEVLIVTLSIAAAGAIKGLNGWVLPLVAIAIQGVLSGRLHHLRAFLKMLLPLGLGSLALLFMYYFWLDQKLGRSFTEEFFLVHHLGRSQAPMEAHSGSILYYFWVIFFGGGALFPFLVQHLKEHSRSWKEVGYPFTFSIVFFVFFTFSATKLPHYLWPIWPALAIAIGDKPHTLERIVMNRITLALCFAPLFFLTALAAFLALSPIALLHEVVNSQAFLSMFPRDYSFPALSRVCFALAALVGATLVVQRRHWITKPAALAGASTAMLLLLVVGITPVIQERIHAPAEQIAASLKALGVTPGTCVRYSGPHSPTLSLALGSEILHNRCEPNDMAVLIAPEWKLKECEERGMQVVRSHGYLSLCVDPKRSADWKALPNAEIPSSHPDSTRTSTTQILPGRDGIDGTEDDVVISKQKEPLEGVVIAQYAGPDQTLGTEDDIPASPVMAALSSSRNQTPAQAKLVPSEIQKKIRVQHLGLQKNNEPVVMSFIDNRTIEIRRSGRDQKPMTADDQIMTQQAGADQKWGTQDDLILEQYVGTDQQAGTADDEVKFYTTNSKGLFITAEQEEKTQIDLDLSLPLPKQNKGKPKSKTTVENKIQHLGLQQDHQQTFSFVGADGIDQTADDVLITRSTRSKRTAIQYAGPDSKLGTEDDILESRTIGPDLKAGTDDDIVVFTQAGPDRISGTADDTSADASLLRSAMTTTGTSAATPVQSAAVRFPKPAATPMARKSIKKVSTPSLQPDSPKKVIQDAFDKNAKTIETQVMEMDYCEAYLCDDEYQSARVLENIETLIEEFPDAQFKAKQIVLLEQSLAKALEYKKNWRKFTPEYEIGLMTQEQVDEAMNPLINKMKTLVQKLKLKK
jgi:4-amino-4-deoxy-L-arabinose transferase-like glycosyltransferase